MLSRGKTSSLKLQKVGFCRLYRKKPCAKWKKITNVKMAGEMPCVPEVVDKNGKKCRVCLNCTLKRGRGCSGPGTTTAITLRSSKQPWSPKMCSKKCELAGPSRCKFFATSGQAKVGKSYVCYLYKACPRARKFPVEFFQGSGETKCQLKRVIGKFCPVRKQVICPLGWAAESGDNAVAPFVAKGVKPKKHKFVLNPFNPNTAARKCYEHCAKHFEKIGFRCDGLRIRVSPMGNAGICWYWSGRSKQLAKGYALPYTKSQGGISCCRKSTCKPPPRPEVAGKKIVCREIHRHQNCAGTKGTMSTTV